MRSHWFRAEGSIIDGRVRCPTRRLAVDVETCYDCAAFKRVADSGQARVICRPVGVIDTLPWASVTRSH